jgi:hypothetical protein
MKIIIITHKFLNIIDRMKYIYPHLGLGDHLICNGLIREIIKKEPNESYGIISKPHTATSVKFMYRDLENISIIEGNLGRRAVEGQRKKPNGTILQWKQLGVLEVLEDSQQPFYIEWISKDHPSSDGTAHTKLTELFIVGDQNSSLKSLNEFKDTVLQNTKLNFINSESVSPGIKEIAFDFKGDKVLID